MSNIKITIEGVEREYVRTNGNFSDIDFVNNIYLKGQWYREVEEVKKDYEILSFNFRHRFWDLNDGFYRSESFKCYYDLEIMLIHVKEMMATINSVRRLTDGEVFTVGEAIEGHGKIYEISINNVEEISIHDVLGTGISLFLAVKVKQPTILLTTEDGVEITDRKTELFACDTNFFKGIMLAKNIPDSLSGVAFSTSEARDEYILQNKPITVTYKEFINNVIGDRAFFKSKQK